MDDDSRSNDGIIAIVAPVMGQHADRSLSIAIDSYVDNQQHIFTLYAIVSQFNRTEGLSYHHFLRFDAYSHALQYRFVQYDSGKYIPLFYLATHIGQQYRRQK